MASASLWQRVRLKQQDGLDRDYILEYSMARGEWWSIAIPDVKGGNNQLYWGEQRFSGGAFYFGALAFALCFMVDCWNVWLRWPLLVMAACRGVVVARCRCLDRRVPRSRALVQQVPRHEDDAGARAVDCFLGAAMALHEMMQPRNAAKRWKRRWTVGGAGRCSDARVLRCAGSVVRLCQLPSVRMWRWSNSASGWLACALTCSEKTCFGPLGLLLVL